MHKKLYRNEHDRAVAGVASGLADYLEMDKAIVKLLFVLSTLFLAGSGLLIYAILWIVVPVNKDPEARMRHFNQYFQQEVNMGTMYGNPTANKENHEEYASNWDKEHPYHPNEWSSNTGDSIKMVFGGILLLIGILFTLKNFAILPAWVNLFKLYKLWPLAIVAVGLMLIFRKQNKKQWKDFEQQNATSATETEPSEEEPAATGDNIEQQKD